MSSTEVATPFHCKRPTGEWRQLGTATAPNVNQSNMPDTTPLGGTMRTLQATTTSAKQPDVINSPAYKAQRPTGYMTDGALRILGREQVGVRRVSDQMRLKTRVPLVPPNPKLFLMATSIFMSLAVLAQ